MEKMLQRKKPYKSLKGFPVRNSIVRCFSKTRVHSYVRFLILVFKKCIIYIFLVIFRKFLTYKVCFHCILSGWKYFPVECYKSISKSWKHHSLYFPWVRGLYTKERVGNTSL